MFIFQPAEEGGSGGAKKIINTGILDEYTLDYIIALHCWPDVEVGTTNNIIPDTATMYGTVRTLSEETQNTIAATIQRVISGIASAYKANATLNF